MEQNKYTEMSDSINAKMNMLNSNLNNIQMKLMRNETDSRRIHRENPTLNKRAKQYSKDIALLKVMADMIRLIEERQRMDNEIDELYKSALHSSDRFETRIDGKRINELKDELEELIKREAEMREYITALFARPVS